MVNYLELDTMHISHISDKVKSFYQRSVLLHIKDHVFFPKGDYREVVKIY